MHWRANIVFRFIYHECVKPFPGSIAFLLFSGLYWAFDLNLKPYLFKLMLDELEITVPEDVFFKLMPLAVIIFASLFLRGLVFRIYDYVFMYLKPAMKFNVNKALMGHIMQRSHVFLQKNVSGSLSNQIQEAITILPILVNLVINNFPAHFAAFIISVLIFWHIHLTFALILIGWVVFFISVSLYFSNKAQILSSRVSKKQFIAFGEIVDILHNIFRVKLFNTRNYEAHRLDTYFNQFGRASIRKDKCYFWMYFVQNLSYILYQFFCILMLIYYYKTGLVTVGDFVLILYINRDIIEYLWVLGEDFAKISEYYGGIRQVLNSTLTSYSREQDENEITQTPSDFSITFENVFFKYPDQEKYVFSDLNLKIKHGEKVGIVGYSGAGKSSLINILLRLCDITEGAIKIGDENIKNYGQQEFRDFFSVITQDVSLFNRSIFENIRYGKMDATLEEVIKAAKQANAHDFIEEFAKKYDTLAGQKGANLSQGQRQRIVAACAILKNAPILIMDEATSSLDAVSENLLQTSLNKLMKNKTVIVIAHKLSTLRNMDRIVVLDSGKIVQEGSHQELARKKGLYSKLIKALSI